MSNLGRLKIGYNEEDFQSSNQHFRIILLKKGRPAFIFSNIARFFFSVDFTEFRAKNILFRLQTHQRKKFIKVKST